MLRFEATDDIWIAVKSEYQGEFGEINEEWSLDSLTKTTTIDSLDLTYPAKEHLSKREVAAIYLLEDAGYVRLESSLDEVDSSLRTTHLRICWDGYEYLDILRDAGIWEKTKETVRSEGGNFAIEMIRSVALAIAKKQLSDKANLQL